MEQNVPDPPYGVFFAMLIGFEIISYVYTKICTLRKVKDTLVVLL